MKAHETWGLVVAAGLLATMVLQLTQLTGWTEGPDLWRQALWVVVPFLAKILVGAWLFWTAERNGDSRWVWLALGLAFGLVAVILYFLLRTLEQHGLGAGRGGGVEALPGGADGGGS